MMSTIGFLKYQNTIFEISHTRGEQTNTRPHAHHIIVRHKQTYMANKASSPNQIGCAQLTNEECMLCFQIIKCTFPQNYDIFSGKPIFRDRGW